MHMNYFHCQHSLDYSTETCKVKIKSQGVLTISEAKKKQGQRNAIQSELQKKFFEFHNEQRECFDARELAEWKGLKRAVSSLNASRRTPEKSLLPKFE
jgi:hypothetical protein